MKTKKGFTLVELLAVIVVIGLIASLVLVKVIDLVNDSKQKGDAVLEQTVKTAAKQYVKSNESVKNRIKSGSNLLISYKDLIDKGYLTENLSSFKNLSDGKNIDVNSSYVCIKYVSDDYSYTLTTSATCQ